MVWFSSLLSIALCYSPVAAASLDVANDTENTAQVTASARFYRPTLQLGSKGVEVSELQAALKLLGFYTDAVDGFYGDTTAQAVAKFQQAAGLNPDGVVGSDTWRNLFPPAPSTTTGSSDSNNSVTIFTVPSTTDSRTATTASQKIISNPNPDNSPPPSVNLPILRLGMSGSAVIGLQQRLRALSFFKGEVDGVFGSETQAAVKSAQENFKLNPDGIVGSATWNALLR